MTAIIFFGEMLVASILAIVLLAISQLRMSSGAALFAGDVMGTGYHAVAASGLRPGETRIRARASDLAGRVQPEQPEWNALGYAANFIHDGERLWIVDWEYAGMGDPAFDLANFAVNNGLDEDGDRVLLGAYGGADPGVHLLMRFVSDYREAMWGVVQQAVSALDFDFAAYAAEHFERLARTAAEPQFRRALA